jgi:hypothetical protein
MHTHDINRRGSIKIVLSLAGDAHALALGLTRSWRARRISVLLNLL